MQRHFFPTIVVQHIIIIISIISIITIIKIIICHLLTALR